MNRRGFLGSILAACAAPAIVRADSLMRIIPRDAAVLLSTELEGGELTSIEWADANTYNQVRFGPGGVFIVPEGVKSVWVKCIGGGGGGLVRGNTPWEQFLHHQRLVAVTPGERLIVVAK